VQYVSNVFVVYRSKPDIQPHEAAAVTEGNLTELRLLARARAAIVVQRAREYRLRQPGAPAVAWFTHAIDYQRKPGKPRIVFDLRDLDEHLTDLPFRMASAWDVVRQWRKGAWFATVDIKGGYYHVRMDAGVRKYLVFKFDGRYYRFNRLPMGLKTAPAIFCALSAELTRMLRRAGVNVVVTYIDDLIVMADSEANCASALAAITALFAELNVAIQPTKVQGPAQSIVELGLRLVSSSDSDDYVTVPGDTLFNVLIDLAILEALTAAGQHMAMVQRQFMERLAGRLVWVSTTSPMGAAAMRPLWALLHASQPGSAGGMLSTWNLRRDLRAPVAWWLDDVLCSPTRVMRAPLDALAAGNAAALRTDAGDQFYGGFVVHSFTDTSYKAPQHACWGTWRTSFSGGSQPSSEWRELFAILAALLTFNAFLRGKLLLFLCDNAAAVAALNAGRSGRDSADRLAMAIRRAGLVFGVDFVALWVAREAMTLPDALSKSLSLSMAQSSMDAYAAAQGQSAPRVAATPGFAIPAHGDGRIQIAEQRPRHGGFWWDDFPLRSSLFL
jgi:hypothetical protein